MNSNSFRSPFVFGFSPCAIECVCESGVQRIEEERKERKEDKEEVEWEPEKMVGEEKKRIENKDERCEMEEEEGKGDGWASDKVEEQNTVQGKQRMDEEEVE